MHNVPKTFAIGLGLLLGFGWVSVEAGQLSAAALPCAALSVAAPSPNAASDQSRLADDPPCCIDASKAALRLEDLPSQAYTMKEESSNGKYWRSFRVSTALPAGAPTEISTMIQPLVSREMAVQAFTQARDSQLRLGWETVSSDFGAGDESVAFGGRGNKIVWTLFRRGTYFVETYEVGQSAGYDRDELPQAAARAKIMSNRLDAEIARQAGGSASAPVAAAKSSFVFTLGFKALADQIQDVVGDPVENEYFNLSNGNSEQHTTKGLMVWRKADNWTAYTNGSMTWINGPNGVQSRPNTERFDWEKDEPATAVEPPVAQKPTATPAPTAASPAPTPAPTPAVPARRYYAPDVKAMDEKAAGPGATVKTLMQEINEEWATAWGWRPSRPTTIYLYFDGYTMADGIGQITGYPLSATERENVANNVAGGALSRDVKTGGFAVVMNLGHDYGAPSWEVDNKVVLIHEYTHVMQQDVARGVGPIWFLEGMAEVTAYTKVQSSPALPARTGAVSAAIAQNRLPGLRQFQADWDAIVERSRTSSNEAYGASYLAVKYLADKVGGMPLLQVLQKVAAGSDFDAALSSVTGYTVGRLETEYRTSIPKQ